MEYSAILGKGDLRRSLIELVREKSLFASTGHDWRSNCRREEVTSAIFYMTVVRLFSVMPIIDI